MPLARDDYEMAYAIKVHIAANMLPMALEVLGHFGKVVAIFADGQAYVAHLFNPHFESADPPISGEYLIQVHSTGADAAHLGVSYTLRKMGDDSGAVPDEGAG